MSSKDFVQVRLKILVLRIFSFVNSMGAELNQIKGSIELTHGSVYSVARKSQSMDLLKWLDLSETSYNYFIVMPFISVYTVPIVF